MLVAMLAAAALPLPPRGKWIVEYADDMCVLSRQFGTNDDGPTVAIRPWPLGNSTEFVLAEIDRGTGTNTGKATVLVEPGARKVSGEYKSWHVAGRPLRLTTVTVSQEALGDLSDAATIRLARGGTDGVTARVDKLASALTALRTCQDDLLRSWKIDPNERAQVATPPRGAGNEAEFISWVDYPIVAIQNRNIGTTTMLWAVGVDGRVSECRIVGSSGTKALDDAACGALTRRGRYTPALSKDGKPMVTHMTRRVIWRLP